MGNDTTKAAPHAKSTSIGRHGPVLISAGLGLVLTFIAFMVACQWGQKQIQNDLRRAGTVHSFALQREIGQHLLLVQSVEGLFNSSKKVTADEFSSFLQPFFKRLPNLQGIGWLPRITDAERQSFENEQRPKHPDFTIRDMDSSGKRVVAAQRQEYFPITFLARHEANKRVLGWDFLGDTELSKSLLWARDTGKMAVTSKIEQAIGGESRKYRFMTMLPIYRSNMQVASIVERRNNLLGFVVGSHRIGNIIDQTLAGLDEMGIDIHLFDGSSPENSRFLYFHPSPASKTSSQMIDDETILRAGLHHSNTLNLADRKWLVFATPTPAFISERRTLQPWVILGTGLIFTYLLTFYILTIQRATLQARQFADEQAKSKKKLEKALEKQKRVEQDLRNHARKLEHLNKVLTRRNEELDEFTYVASHDLQEPLRKITAFGSLLEMDLGDELPEDAKENLDFLTDAASRMQVLVNDLLSLSRSGRREMKRELIPLDECVDAALQALDVLVEESGVEIRRVPLPEVWGDRTLLTQLYQNLLHNAIKFVRDQKPIVHLSAEQSKDGWLLGVQDNGIGIDPQYITQIFAPFKRLHGRGDYQGSGIGLAVCRKAVERHGGSIWAESELGNGSYFKFTIADQKENNP